MLNAQRKRLFFGAEVISAWPDTLPRGRVIGDGSRHLTLAFLGEIDYRPLLGLLAQIPTPSFSLGLSGQFDQCLFLPPRRPHVVSWHVRWFEALDQLEQYHGELNEWLQSHQYPIDQRPFLPHVTLARWPFDRAEWNAQFRALPMYVAAIHLYESIGSLVYRPLWTHALIAPFEELDHTADIAFRIRGEDLAQLHLHAQLALCFKSPELLDYWKAPKTNGSLEQTIGDLNETICALDANIGSPFKAVSYCGTVRERCDKILEWEMIVDV